MKTLLMMAIVTMMSSVSYGADVKQNKATGTADSQPCINNANTKADILENTNEAVNSRQKEVEQKSGSGRG